MTGAQKLKLPEVKQMSKKYAKVKAYFDNGLWSARQVRNAVIKGWITSAEYEQITGESYSD